MMTTRIVNWRTIDGLKIHCRIWENESALNEIWIVHGTGDHGGRYEELAERFVAAGFRVIIADHRGNGLSEGKRGHVPYFNAYLEDLQQTIQQTQTSRQPFILGQSMGSLIVARYLMSCSQDFEKAVLLSPMFRTRNPPPRLKLFLARLVRKFYPGLTLKAGIKSRDLTADEGRLKNIRKDDLRHGLVSAELGLSLFEQGEQALREADQIHIPTLVMHGDLDKITCPEASREFAGNNEIVTLKIWSDMRHELYNDANAAKVLAFVLGWLNE